MECVVIAIVGATTLTRIVYSDPTEDTQELWHLCWLVSEKGARTPSMFRKSFHRTHKM